MTFIAALRHDRISAPWVIDGPINGELFTRRESIGAHLGQRRGRHPRQPRQSQGQGGAQRHPRHAHLLFLPPYSPDLNPIEQVFAKLKHLMRAAQTRDVEATWRKVGELLDIFSKEECANYLRNPGYVSI
jgi:transposase